jgi:hypothetical protein
MAQIKVTYIACDYEYKFPVVSADSFDNLKLALDDYCGAGERNSGKCLGFTPYNTKYPDDYEGYYEYECCKNGNDWNSGTYIDKFRVYCIEFYPETKYDVAEKTFKKEII